MSFNRPPRIQQSLPTDSVEIPGPPAPPPSPGSMNLLTILLPLGAVLLTVVLVVFLSGQNSSMTSYLIFIPLMLITYVVTGVTYFTGKRNYVRQLAKARADYQLILQETETRLAGLQKKQQRVLREANPDPADCLQRAQTQSALLGERRPDDSDFLALRLGLGSTPASITLKPVEHNNRAPEFEKEFETADQLYETYRIVADAPLLAQWTVAGSVGLAGKRADILNTARAILGQLVTHHWPAEVQLAVLAGPDKAADWQWTYRLPHAATMFKWQALPPKDETNPPEKLMTALEAELQRREQILESLKLISQAGGPPATPLPRLLLVFDTVNPNYAHPGMSLLLRKGPQLGIYGLFLTERAQLVPSECGAIAEVQANRVTYRETGASGRKLEGRADSLDPKQCDGLTRSLAAITWPKSADVAQPPANLGFLEMFGAATVEELPIESWWDGHNPFGYLRAPIGKTSATADLIFDLNDADGAHGPHGLIGGMTGSGKSEVLKTVILALAITHHPYDLNFALVDFKGGAAFNELAHLPHTVGVVTDMESHATYAERVIQALAGEVEHRKRVFEDARRAFGFGRSHVDEYRLLAVKRPLPRLVLVFDEFAEFKQRQPEEAKRLISIARVGRSLGVHLVLATQNIQEAIDPQILQNCTFRICLKVSEAQDSIQMVGIPDAIQLTRGRAYFSAKGRRLFQSAFAGGPYGTQRPDVAPTTGLVRVLRSGVREPIYTPSPLAKPSVDQGQGSTEAHVIIEHLNKLASKLRLKKPPAVWPDPLPSRVFLPALLRQFTTGGWLGDGWQHSQLWTNPGDEQTNVPPILGLYDNPAKQTQPIFLLDPSRGNGHLLVFGAAGSGKSVLLKTLAIHLARTRLPSQVHIYALDYGGQSSLKVLEALPHVGAVASRVEPERAERLIQFVQRELARRNEFFRVQRVGNLQDFNARMEPDKQLPVLYLLIDGFGEFKRSFSSDVINGVSSLVSGGAAAGLYLVIASSLPADVPPDLLSNINDRLTFNQASQTEYYSIVGQPSEAKLKEDAARTPPPGRGLLRGTPPLEFQAALPIDDRPDKSEAEQITELGEQMRLAWPGALPMRILGLAPRVTLPVTPRSPARAPLITMLGQDYETLAPIGLALDEDGPTFLIAGATPRSGKTTLLRSWVLGLMQAFAPDRIQFVILDAHSRTMAPFRGYPHTMDYVGTKAALEPAVTKLAALIRERADQLDQAYEADPTGAASRELAASMSHLVIVIDDYDLFAIRVESERRQLGSLLALGDELGVSFIIAGNAAELPRDFEDPLIQRVRRQGCGVLLGGHSGIDQFNNARLSAPQISPNLPAGRGYLVRRGQVRLFQGAAYWQEHEDPDQALAERLANSHLQSN